MSQPVFSATLLTERLENFPSWMGIKKLATHQCLPAAWILSACVFLAQKVQQHGITSLPLSLCLSLSLSIPLCPSIYLSLSTDGVRDFAVIQTNGTWISLLSSTIFGPHGLGHDIQPPAFGQHSLPLVGQF